MTKRLAILALPVLLLLVAACGSSASPSPSAAAAGDITGAWTVSSVGGTFVDATAPPTMEFGVDGNVTGTTGCNSYNGTYTVDGSTIEIGALAMTLMLCEGAVGTQETAFSAALQGATTWSIAADGTLTLSGAGDIVARPTA